MASEATGRHLVVSVDGGSWPAASLTPGRKGRRPGDSVWVDEGGKNEAGIDPVASVRAGVGRDRGADGGGHVVGEGPARPGPDQEGERAPEAGGCADREVE